LLLLFLLRVFLRCPRGSLVSHVVVLREKNKNLEMHVTTEDTEMIKVGGVYTTQVIVLCWDFVGNIRIFM
jgi:hypothetical protein